MTQTWVDLAFIHWPINPQLLRELIPEPLEIDTFDGLGWVGVVPFGMTKVRLRYALQLPYLSQFLELNVRSYVRWKGKSGVFFFSLDAANPIAVEVARAWFRLPYFNARMLKEHCEDRIFYLSERTDQRGRQAGFKATYGPTGGVYYSRPGTIDAWLTERYCFHAVSNGGKVVTGEIHHKPWPLQPAKAAIEKNSMMAAIGLDLPDSEPLVHFVRELETIEWAITSNS
jgi:uncharacterized protein YqjF (DUF2071 family)